MNLNKVILIGRLTADPDARTTPSGQSVTTIRLATSRTWNDQSTHEKREATEFHTIVTWGRLAEITAQYLKKGALAMFEGRLQTRSWDDKNTGQKRYMTEIVAENMQMGPRPAGTGYNAGQPVADINPPVRSAGPQSRPAPVEDADIPIIDENEIAQSSGIDETTVKDVDLPF